MSLQLGIQQFNSREFYQCHDTLEEIWIEAPEMDKRFYQGVLQVAVACHHLSNHNQRGAIILLGEAIRRLNDYQPDYYGVDVSELMTQSINLLQALQLLEEAKLEQFVQEIFTKGKTNISTEESVSLPEIALVEHP